MKKMLRSLRIVMSLIFLGASATYLIFTEHIHPVAQYSERLQILPSLLGMTAGISIFWVAVTLLIGRVYCSTVCPLGTVQDAAIFLRKKVHPHPAFRYESSSWLRLEALVVFLLCLTAGFSIVYAFLDPWQIFRHIASILHPEPLHIEALHITVTAGAGVIAGIISLILLTVISFFYGREFCNSFCPVGVGMKMLDRFTVYNIEINPDKCTSCLVCQDICKSRCIDVKTRTVDNSRCVRCFDCIDQCPDDAINLTSMRHRPATPVINHTQK